MKIHCSSLSLILTSPKSKEDRLNGNLSETAKKEIRRIWIADTYDKHKEYYSKYTDKGNGCEEIGITMFSKHHGNFPYLKNEKMYSNDYLVGTPDIVDDDFVVDIKCPWDIENFMTAAADDYYEQMQGYMILTGKSKAILAYCLVDAPEWMIEDEIRRLRYRAAPDMGDEIEEAVKRNMTFNNVEPHLRVKTFEILKDVAFEANAYKVIDKARSYYATLSLSNVKPVEV